jgi:hypothetical protein
MAYRIEIKGPCRYLVLGLVILFCGSNWLAPDLLAGLTGSGGRNWRLLRSGHIERYERNLADHWLTAAKGTYETGEFPVLGGEDVVLEFDVDRIEGGVGFRLVRYEWGVWQNHVWSEGIRDDRSGSVRLTVPRGGLYGLKLDFYAFGDVTLDWSVDRRTAPSDHQSGAAVAFATGSAGERSQMACFGIAQNFPIAGNQGGWQRTGGRDQQAIGGVALEMLRKERRGDRRGDAERRQTDAGQAEKALEPGMRLQIKADPGLAYQQPDLPRGNGGLGLRL